MSIGERIRQRRVDLGYNQRELAELLKITPSAVANYENGISCPKEEILYSLFSHLKCDANFLFQDEMNEENSEHQILLTEHQRKVIDAYIAQPEMQNAVDKLLGIVY